MEVEIESEELGILTNHCRRNDRKDIIVSFLRNLVFLQQLPKISLLWVLEHQREAAAQRVREEERKKRIAEEEKARLAQQAKEDAERA